MSNKRLGIGFSTCLAVAALAIVGCGDDDGDDDDGGKAGASASAGRGGGGSGGATAGTGGSKAGAGGSKAGAGGSSAGSGGASAGAGGQVPAAGAAGASGGGAGGAADTARVRVLHLSSDAPGVDVFVNGATSPVVEDLEFPKGTPYLEVPAGEYDFAVAATGSTPDEAVLTIEDLELESGASYTAVAYDELTSIKALPLVDDYADLAAGQIRVRAVHAAPAVGEVDLWNVPASGEPQPLWTDVDFGEAGDALDVPAGAYTIGVDVDDDATPDLTFELPALPAGTVANVFAVNAGEDVFLLAQLEDGTTARIDPE